MGGRPFKSSFRTYDRVPNANENRNSLPYGLWLKAGDNSQNFNRQRDRDGDGHRGQTRQRQWNQGGGGASSSVRPPPANPANTTHEHEQDMGDDSVHNNDVEGLDVDAELRKIEAENSLPTMQNVHEEPEDGVGGESEGNATYINNYLVNGHDFLSMQVLAKNRQVGRGVVVHRWVMVWVTRGFLPLSKNTTLMDWG